MNSTSSDIPPFSPITATTPASHNHPIIIDTTIPPVNPTPVELDGTPTTPPKSTQRTPNDVSAGGSTFSPDAAPADDEVLEALDGASPGMRQREREKREREREARRRDPAVLVDIPQEPGAEELEVAAEALEGGERGSGEGVSGAGAGAEAGTTGTGGVVG